jgi:hypothetical protein
LIFLCSRTHPRFDELRDVAAIETEELRVVLQELAQGLVAVAAVAAGQLAAAVRDADRLRRAGALALLHFQPGDLALEPLFGLFHGLLDFFFLLLLLRAVTVEMALLHRLRRFLVIVADVEVAFGVFRLGGEGGEGDQETEQWQEHPSNDALHREPPDADGREPARVAVHTAFP